MSLLSYTHDHGNAPPISEPKTDILFNQKLIDGIAKMFKIPDKEARFLFNSFFDYIRDTIEDPNDELPIRLYGLCRWQMKPGFHKDIGHMENRSINRQIGGELKKLYMSDREEYLRLYGFHLPKEVRDENRAAYSSRRRREILAENQS